MLSGFKLSEFSFPSFLSNSTIQIAPGKLYIWLSPNQKSRENGVEIYKKRQNSNSITFS